ncbi:MoxR family ATPase [Haloarchaeobius sp. FL176]|uniref:AAA family ATPase n=1 Tax=Haloarchaeobius sp. FL176 TaxID=2967129 RepID=UPI0021493A90|nr:MoxR family ATPase [Haloarchaeobius sp. FL176]
MDVATANDMGADVLDEVSNVVIADDQVLENVLTALYARGHVLLEDVPGTGKTLTARTMATTLGLSFSRIQFTPDLLPADITGTKTFAEDTGEFDFNPGPVFANVVLADELNRASPKTQAALLEAMEEKQVTVDGQTYDLPTPFIVIATQNPVESGEGTFPLPEAQQDRFLLKESFGYPDKDGERMLLDRRERRTDPLPSAQRILSPDNVQELQTAPERVTVHGDLKDYMLRVVRATRTDDRVEVGVSPRGTQRVFETVRARAALHGRDFARPSDVKTLGEAVLAHRLVLETDAMVDDVAEADVVEEILADEPVPRISREAPQ